MRLTKGMLRASTAIPPYMVPPVRPSARSSLRAWGEWMDWNNRWDRASVRALLGERAYKDLFS